MRAWLDEAELVHVAAMATRRPPAAVLATTDVAALAHVVAHLEQATTRVEAAATAVLEIGRRRPFGDGSTATAWLAGAHLLALDGLSLRIGPVGAAGVIATDERIGVAEVAAVLLEHSEPRRSRIGRLLRPLFEVHRPDGPSLLPCPACGLPVVRRRNDIALAGPWSSSAVAQRVARCAVEHRTHDRWARQLVPA
jgi:hypothetical protein